MGVSGQRLAQLGNEARYLLNTTLGGCERVQKISLLTGFRSKDRPDDIGCRALDKDLKKVEGRPKGEPEKNNYCEHLYRYRVSEEDEGCIGAQGRGRS